MKIADKSFKWHKNMYKIFEVEFLLSVVTTLFLVGET